MFTGKREPAGTENLSVERLHLADGHQGPGWQADLDMQPSLSIRIYDFLASIPGEVAEQLCLLQVGRFGFSHGLPRGDWITMLLVEGFDEEGSAWRKMRQIQSKRTRTSAVIDGVGCFERVADGERGFHL